MDFKHGKALRPPVLWLLKVVTALTDLCVLLTVVFEGTPGSQAAARDRDALRTELAVPRAPAAGLPCSGGTFPSPLLGKKGCPQSHPEGKIKQGNKADKLSNWCGLAQLCRGALSSSVSSDKWLVTCSLFSVNSGFVFSYFKSYNTVKYKS